MSRHSLFTQGLDRIAAVAYLLGAVVPLGMLALVVSKPELSRHATFAMSVVVAFTGLLSLGAYLALRRSTHQAIAQMDDDNRRLGALLGASQSFATQGDIQGIADETVRHGLALTGAHVAAILRVDGDATVLAAAGGLAGSAAKEARDLAWELRLHLDNLNPDETPTTLCLADGREATLVALAAKPGGVKAVLLLAGWSLPESHAEVGALVTLARLSSSSIDNADLRDAQRNFFAHVTSLLSRALAAHLGAQEDHGHRVARLANRVGHAMDLATARLETLHWASVLHDIGMLDIPRHLHDDADARAPHPRIGAEMLAPIRFFEKAAPIVRHHHEQHDGLGFPDHLRGDEIPLEARILAVCDAFDAMTHESMYQATRNPEDAVRELQRCAGTQFDPRVVAIFCRLVEEGVIEVAEETPALA